MSRDGAPMAVVLAATFAVALSFCAPHKIEPAPQGNLPREDGGTSCERACQRRDRLRCNDAGASPTCVQSCTDTERRVPGLLRPECVELAEDCDGIKACATRLARRTSSW